MWFSTTSLSCVWVLFFVFFNSSHACHASCLSFITWKCVPLCLRSMQPSKKAQGQLRVQKKAAEPPGDIWRMPNMAGKWRRSCAPSRAPGLSGTRSYEAAHTRLCLLSLWHGKTTSRRHGKRRESREKWGEAETKGGWMGERMSVRRSKWARRHRP